MNIYVNVWKLLFLTLYGMKLKNTLNQRLGLVYVYKICLILKWQSNIGKRFLLFIIVHINGFYLNVVSKIEINFKIRVTELNTKIEIRIDYKCFLFNGPLFAKMLLLLRFNYLSGTSEFVSASKAKFDSSNWWVINEPKQIDSYQITFIIYSSVNREQFRNFCQHIHIFVKKSFLFLTLW